MRSSNTRQPSSLEKSLEIFVKYIYRPWHYPRRQYKCKCVNKSELLYQKHLIMMKYAALARMQKIMAKIIASQRHQNRRTQHLGRALMTSAAILAIKYK